MKNKVGPSTAPLVPLKAVAPSVGPLKVGPLKVEVHFTKTASIHFDQSLEHHLRHRKLDETLKISWKYICDVIRGRDSIEPLSWVTIVWEWLVVLSVIYFAITVPGGLAFGTIPSVNSCNLTLIWVLRLDILIYARTGYVDVHGDIIYDPKKIMWRYFRGNFITDLVSVLPFYLFAPVICDDTDCNETAVEAGLNCLVLLRMRSLFFDNNILEKFFMTPIRRIVKLILGWILLGHMFACVFFFVGNSQEASGWVEQEDIANSPTWEQYVTSLYWAFSTMTTVGYGDITPVTPLERLVVLPLYIVSAVTYASLFGNMAYAIEEIQFEAKTKANKVHMIKAFSKSYNVSPVLEDKLLFYTDAMFYQNKGFEVNEVTKDLPQSVRTEIMMHLHGKHLSKAPIFSKCSQAFLQAIVLRMRTTVCLEGDYLFHAGEKSNDMYFMRGGHVGVCMEDCITGLETVVAVISPESENPFFGEIALLLGEVRTASCVSLNKCAFSKLTKHDFDSVAVLFEDEYDKVKEAALCRVYADIRRHEKALTSSLQSPQGKVLGDGFEDVQKARFVGLSNRAHRLKSVFLGSEANTIDMVMDKMVPKKKQNIAKTMRNWAHRASGGSRKNILSLLSKTNNEGEEVKKEKKDSEMRVELETATSGDDGEGIPVAYETKSLLEMMGGVNGVGKGRKEERVREEEQHTTDGAKQGGRPTRDGLISLQEEVMINKVELEAGKQKIIKYQVEGSMGEFCTGISLAAFMQHPSHQGWAGHANSHKASAKWTQLSEVEAHRHHNITPELLPFQEQTRRTMARLKASIQAAIRFKQMLTPRRKDKDEDEDEDEDASKGDGEDDGKAKDSLTVPSDRDELIAKFSKSK